MSFLCSEKSDKFVGPEGGDDSGDLRWGSEEERSLWGSPQRSPTDLPRLNEALTFFLDLPEFLDWCLEVAKRPLIPHLQAVPTPSNGGS